nr:MAG TPA: hypothetical protein [Siphoviridae sp. cttiG1]
MKQLSLSYKTEGILFFYSDPPFGGIRKDDK